MGLQAGLAYAAAAVLAFAAAALVAHELGEADYGAYSFGLAVAGVVAILATRGGDQLAVRAMSVSASRNEPHGASSFLREARRDALALAGSGAALAVCLALVAGAGERAGLLALAAPIAPALALANIGRGALEGLARPVAAAVAPTLVRALAFAGLACGLLAAGSLAPGDALVAQAIAALVALVATEAAVRRTLRARIPPSAVAPARWATSSWLLLTSSGVLAVQPSVGVFALALLENDAATGRYAAAMLSMAGFALILTSARALLAPGAAALHAAGDTAALQRETTRATRWAFFVSLALAVPLFALAEPLLGILGSGFEEGAPTLRIVVLAQLANAYAAYNGMLLAQTGNERASATAAGIGFTVNVAGAALLVPLAGVEGAAIALVAGTIGRNVLAGRATRRLLGVDSTALGTHPG